jgi:outer membrane protein
MKEKILLVLACSALLTAKAQQPASRWSMDDCMRYAVEHSTTVEKQQYNLDNAKAGMQAAVSAFLPSVQAGSQRPVQLGTKHRPKHEYV